MVIVDGQRWVWKDQLIFFPNLEESRQLIESLRLNTVLRIRQTSVELLNSPNVIRSGVFRTSCVDLTKDLGAIYDEMDSMTKRYIKKAEKMKETVQIRLNDLRAYEDFMKLYNDFVRLKAHTYPLSPQRFREYLNVSDVWVIYLDERPVAGRLLVRDDTVKRVRMVLSPTSRLSSKEDAKLSGTLNRYLHWHELLTYKDKGIQVYDFGGVGDGSSTIAKFKLSFGGVCVQENSYVAVGGLGRLGYKGYEFMTKLRRDIRAVFRRKE